MRRRKETYRPSKAEGVMGLVVGVIFVLIGLIMVIPTFGLFGLLWTAIAVGITVSNGYRAFGKKYIGPEIHIEEETEENSALQTPQQVPEFHDHIPSTALDAKGRMEQLETLKAAGLITQEEYQKKRSEILRDL